MHMTAIRQATVADAGLLATLAEKTFRDTFVAENSTTDMNLHCTKNFSAEIQRREILDPNYVTILAGQDGEWVAFAQVRLHSPIHCVRAENPSELLRLYVATQWHGKGIAREVMSEALATAARSGADYIWLGVWEQNPKAIAFYRKCGFSAVGDRVFHVGDDPQRDLVMAMEIDGQPAA
jgi:ribosomal protein S18 acetylase RimI-like enzyme